MKTNYLFVLKMISDIEKYVYIKHFRKFSKFFEVQRAHSAKYRFSLIPVLKKTKDIRSIKLKNRCYSEKDRFLN